VPIFADRGMLRGQRGGYFTVVNLGIPDRNNNNNSNNFKIILRFFYWKKGAHKIMACLDKLSNC
jgi:hypothetical protein